MPTRFFLGAGLLALAASIVGGSLQGASTVPSGRRGGHMFGYGHMSSYQGASGTAGAIEGGRELVVTADDFAFSPAELTVEPGETVNLTLVNEGALPHDLVIPELDVRITAAPGGRVTTGFVARQPGSFQILCTYPGHADAGMTGTLTVGEDAR